MNSSVWGKNMTNPHARNSKQEEQRADAVGFSMPQVEARYRRYVDDHHGDVSDIANICETFWNAGAQAAIRATTQFSDLLPRVTRIEERVAELHGMLQAIASGAES